METKSHRRDTGHHDARPLREHERHGVSGNGVPDASRDLAAAGLHGLQGLERLVDGGAGVLEETMARVGQRDVA